MAFPLIIPLAFGAVALLASSGSSSGGGIIPPCRGRLSSKYGPRIHPVTGESKLHKGLDVAVPTGTPIVSVYDGEVIKAAQDSTSGNLIKIDHGKGIVTAYMHLSRIDVSTGQRIRKGQRIGLSGATGRVTGPHLHFEIRRDGKHIDPLKVIPESLFAS